MVPGPLTLMAGLWLAASPGCTAPPPVVDVRVNRLPVRLEHDKSVAELSRIAMDPNAPPVYALMETHGFTQTYVKVENNTVVSSTPAIGGLPGCSWVSQMSLTIHIDATVYIASDFAESGCEYIATRDHENRHVEAELRVAEANLPALRQVALAATAAGGVAGPRPGDSDAVRGLMRAGLGQALQGFVQNLTLARQRAQWSIDSPDEYRRVKSLCPGFQ